MGSKNNPGKFDCHAAADPDEPLFTLRASDSTAPLVVTLWLALKRQMKVDGTSQISDEKLAEAREVIQKMQQWGKDKGKDHKAAAEAFNKVVNRARERALLAESLDK